MRWVGRDWGCRSVLCQSLVSNRISNYSIKDQHMALFCCYNVTIQKNDAVLIYFLHPYCPPCPFMFLIVNNRCLLPASFRKQSTIYTIYAFYLTLFTRVKCEARERKTHSYERQVVPADKSLAFSTLLKHNQFISSFFIFLVGAFKGV